MDGRKLGTISIAVIIIAVAYVAKLRFMLEPSGAKKAIEYILFMTALVSVVFLVAHAVKLALITAGNILGTISRLEYSRSDPSSIASMERTLSSEMETLRKETERRLEPIENRLTATVKEVKMVAERIVQEKVDKEIGGNLLESIGKKVAEQASDYAKKENLKLAISTAFNTSSTRIKAHAEVAEKTARLFRVMGLTLAWAGIVLAAINLLIFYADILREGGPAPGEASQVDYMRLLKHLPFTFPFIILAEVLALVMFRYQSKALEMMRYFSNEVTTLSLRQAGALVIVEYGSQKAVSDLAGDLMKAERNIIIRKDEKTVEIAQNRDEDAFLKAVTNKMEAILKRDKAGASAH